MMMEIKDFDFADELNLSHSIHYCNSIRLPC